MVTLQRILYNNWKKIEPHLPYLALDAFKNFDLIWFPRNVTFSKPYRVCCKHSIMLKKLTMGSWWISANAMRIYNHSVTEAIQVSQMEFGKISWTTVWNLKQRQQQFVVHRLSMQQLVQKSRLLNAVRRWEECASTSFKLAYHASWIHMTQVQSTETNVPPFWSGLCSRLSARHTPHRSDSERLTITLLF